MERQLHWPSLRAVRAVGLAVALAGTSPAFVIGGFNAEYGRDPVPDKVVDGALVASAATTTFGVVIVFGAEFVARRRN